MGDASDMADIERFLRCDAGKAHLQEIVEMLKGRAIVDVTFANHIHSVVTTLHLDDGATFDVWRPSLEVDALRDAFGNELDEEYYRDFPARRPDNASGS